MVSVWHTGVAQQNMARGKAAFWDSTKLLYHVGLQFYVTESDRLVKLPSSLVGQKWHTLIAYLDVINILEEKQQQTGFKAWKGLVESKH